MFWFLFYTCYDALPYLLRVSMVNLKFVYNTLLYVEKKKMNAIFLNVRMSIRLVPSFRAASQQSRWPRPLSCLYCA